MGPRALGVGLLIAGACACPSKQAAPPPSAGSGSSAVVAPPVADATTCAGVRARVEALYRAEAERKEPKRVDDAVADNTAMVMADCAKAPATVAPCVAAAATVAALEKTCLAPLDPEGTDGDLLGGRK